MPSDTAAASSAAPLPVSTDTSALFTPVTLGAVRAANRLVMAPLTRQRAGVDGFDGVPNELMVEHYRQRASLGLIVTEGTWPVIEGRTWYGQPGIETAAQVNGWRRVSAAVHAEGGRIVMQVMHGGRISHPEITGTGRVVSASATAAPGQIRVTEGKADHPTAHALTEDEIGQVVRGFVEACERAMEAGMDGVQLHGANGYLIHQFFSPRTNLRSDDFGASPEGHARLAVEATRAVAERIGAQHTGIRLSPEHQVQGATEEDEALTREIYLAYAREVAGLGLAHVDVLHAQPTGDLVQQLRRECGAPLIANSGFATPTTREEATELVAGGWAEAVGVGRAAIANPDLAERWRTGAPENPADPATFYTRGPEGYTDYPTL